jgi:hypothetical protein
MGLKHAGAFLALMALCAPAAAFDSARTIFYVSIPLAPQAAPMSFGMRLQGSREHQAVDIDARMLRLVSVGGIEAQWLLAGALAVAAAAAIGGDKRAEQQAAATPQPRTSPAPAPQPCPQVCK